jgi:hypothetical protein
MNCIHVAQIRATDGLFGISYPAKQALASQEKLFHGISNFKIKSPCCDEERI